MDAEIKNKRRRPNDLPLSLARLVKMLGIPYARLAELYRVRMGREFPVRTNFITQVINGRCSCPAPLRRIIEQEINLAKARAAMHSATTGLHPESQSTPGDGRRPPTAGSVLHNPERSFAAFLRRRHA